MRPLTPRRILAVCGLLLAVLFVVVVISLRMGAYPISISEIVMTLFRGVAGQREQIPSEFWLVVFGLRLPRIALGILVGAALSTAGAGFQALLRNPLADPYVLGVSSGAALGAIVSLVIAPHVPGLIQLAAFAGAAATITAVYFLGRRGGQLDSPTLLLAGIVSASFLSAIIMFLMTTLSGRDIRGMAFWLMGDLSSPAAIDLRWLYFILLVVLGSIYTTSSDLNLILTGEQEARHLGVNVKRVKLVVYIGASRAHRPRSFGERRDWIRGPAGAARDANDVWYRLPVADSRVGGGRCDCDRDCGYAGAHGGGANGVAGGRDDGFGRSARVYLSDAAESSMSSTAGSGMSSGAQTQTRPFQTDPRSRLKVEQVSYAYSATDRSAPKFILGPVTFEAQQRELIAILGPNASGKSTLLKLLGGVVKPLSGRVEVDGAEVGGLDLRTRAQKIALVQQESELLFPLRVWEYVLQGRYPYGRRLRFESDEDCLMAGNALAQVGADALRDRWMEQLSGGEKQRVILARALSQQPALLLLDEPTQHLDIGGKVELLRRLRKLADENRYTVVVVTHELNLAAEFSDRIVLLQKGKPLRIGTPAQVYQRDLLEEVFEAPLEVELRVTGRPRVILRGSH